jgi:hypothetical protein
MRNTLPPSAAMSSLIVANITLTFAGSSNAKAD